MHRHHMKNEKVNIQKKKKAGRFESLCIILIEGYWEILAF